MVLVSYSSREINAKLVYYGPGLSGKTTNLEYIYGSIPQTQRGKMVSMKTKTERTLFFDFLPVNLGELSGFKTRFLLYTVPGQVYYNATRKLVLKGVDAVVFVADSKRGKMDENLESLQNLKDNLQEHGIQFGEIPLVLQYNKRDLPDVYTLPEMEEVLNPDRLPVYEAVATTGQGVVDTFKGVSRLLLRKLAREIGGSGARTRPATPVAEPPVAPMPAAPAPAAQTLPAPAITAQVPTATPPIWRATPDVASSPIEDPSARRERMPAAGAPAATPVPGTSPLALEAPGREPEAVREHHSARQPAQPAEPIILSPEASVWEVPVSGTHPEVPSEAPSSVADRPGPAMSFEMRTDAEMSPAPAPGPAVHLQQHATGQPRSVPEDPAVEEPEPRDAAELPGRGPSADDSLEARERSISVGERLRRWLSRPTGRSGDLWNESLPDHLEPRTFASDAEISLTVPPSPPPGEAVSTAPELPVAPGGAVAAKGTDVQEATPSPEATPEGADAPEEEPAVEGWAGPPEEPAPREGVTLEAPIRSSEAWGVSAAAPVGPVVSVPPVSPPATEPAGRPQEISTGNELESSGPPASAPAPLVLVQQGAAPASAPKDRSNREASDPGSHRSAGSTIRKRGRSREVIVPLTLDKDDLADGIVLKVVIQARWPEEETEIDDRAA